MTKTILYIIAIIGVVLLQRAFFPLLLGSSLVPYVVIIFGMFLLMERPKIEVWPALALTGFLLGALSANFWIVMTLQLSLFLMYMFFKSRFGIPNNSIFYLIIFFSSLVYAFTILLLTVDPKSLFLSSAFVKIPLLRAISTTAFAIISLPLLRKYFALVSIYEVKIKLPR